MSTKNMLLVLLAVIFVIIGYFVYQVKIEKSTINSNPKNATYLIDGEAVALINGKSEQGENDSGILIQYFGNEAIGDLNGDGRQDTALYITQESSGTGIFYYVVALIDKIDGKKGTEAVFVGDRIAPQNLEIRDGILLVNYADRNEGESFADRPSLGKTMRLKLNTETFKFEIIK